MDVVSLNEIDGDPQTVHASICIIGAGTAGLYLAHRLSAAGRRVVVLEAGPKTPVSTDAAGFGGLFTAQEYRGASAGRAFGLGGTSALWGGQLIAFPQSDGVRGDPVRDSAWRRVLEVVEGSRHAVTAVLGIRWQDAPDDAHSPPGHGAGTGACVPATLRSLQSQWLPFRKRNLTWLIRGRGNAGSHTIFCDAVAAEWHRGEGESGRHRIAQVVARNAAGRRLRIVADRFVIAAGAIESTRILQEIDATADSRVVRRGAALGAYLSDHLSFQVARTSAAQRKRIANWFGPRFRHGTMRSWRFVESNPPPSYPRYFAHVIFSLQNEGFELARAVLQGLQARHWPRISAATAWRGSAGLLCLAWQRCARSRLYIPSGTESHLQLDLEQRPDVSNSIRLGDRLDRIGRPIACVNWRISDADRADMQWAAARFLSSWAVVDGGVADAAADDMHSLLKPHDAYHPVGTCRLGDDTEAVVDGDLKVHGVDNLYLLSTAIFPSGGSANPTFALLCFAEMLAGKIGTRTS